MNWITEHQRAASVLYGIAAGVLAAVIARLI